MPKMPEYLKVISVKLALVALTALYVTCYTKKIYNQMFLKTWPFQQTTPSPLQIAIIQTGTEYVAFLRLSKRFQTWNSTFSHARRQKKKTGGGRESIFKLRSYLWSMIMLPGQNCWNNNHFFLKNFNKKKTTTSKSLIYTNKPFQLFKDIFFQVVSIQTVVINQRQ